MAAPITFVDYATSALMASLEAEMYMRIYQYAAEDFRAVTDCKTAHTLVNSWMTSTNAALTSTNALVSAHTHSGFLGIPTTPPLSPILLTTIAPPATPISTTLATENQGSNFMLPSVNISYTDLTLTGVNVGELSFRRALEIPLTYGVISLATKI